MTASNLNFRKQSITLITGPLSGSNTAILHKLMPKYIREKYNVTLIKERPFNEYSDETKQSDVIVTTHANYPFNPNQINIELWHGFPLKGMANPPLDPRTAKNLSQFWENVDIISSYSSLFNTVFNSRIGTQISKFKITGAPRNDMLIRSDGLQNLEKLTKKSLRNKNIIFYMPTFRQVFFDKNKNDGNRHWHNIFGFNDFDSEQFRQFLSDHQIELFVKLHPVEESVVLPQIKQFESEAINVITSSLLDELNLDLYEILNCSNALITDYSNVYFDYLLLNRPVIFTPVDIEEYKIKRGFLLEPYEKWAPGPKVFDQKSLQSELTKCLHDPNYYESERIQLRDIVHVYQDDKSSERMWKIIDDLLEHKLRSESLQIQSILDVSLLKEKIKNTISTLIERGEISEALQALELYKEEVGTDSDIFCLEGVIAFIENDLSKAVDLFNRAYMLDKTHFDSIYNLAYIQFKLGNLEWSNFYLHKAKKICTDLSLSESIQNMIVEIENTKSKDNKIKPRILIGSPIHQKPAILRYFLKSLDLLKKDSFEVSFFFVDDNIEPESSLFIEEFSHNYRTYILRSHFNDQYIRNENTHYWNEKLIWKVANFKNDMIEFCLCNHFDYLFLIDSDLVLHPNTLNRLVSANKDIISNIFWTKWYNDYIELPQVWLKDVYTLYQSSRNEKLDQAEINRRILEFLNLLKKPGVYKVGGLGACTLISKSALDAGVNFSEISNLSFRGEDRHFCIRAAALGIELYVDTHYPAFHIYRESDLERVDAFMSNCGYNEIMNTFNI